MKVCWSYKDYTGQTMDSGRALCELEAEPLELVALEASALSWLKFAPRCKRVFYADKSVYSILKKNGLLSLYDEVITVDYDKDLWGRYTRLGKFFAYPKMYVMTQQEEPFFMCDTDCVLKTNISKWFIDPSSYYAYFYVEESTRTPENAFRDALLLLSSVAHSSPLLRSFCDYSRTINAGLMYFADPKVAQLTGHTLLEAGIDIQKAIDSATITNQDGEYSTYLLWTLYEESLLCNLIEFLSKQTIQEIPLHTFEEFSEGYRDRYGNNQQVIFDQIKKACQSSKLLTGAVLK